MQLTSICNQECMAKSPWYSVRTSWQYYRKSCQGCWASVYMKIVCTCCYQETLTFLSVPSAHCAQL